MLSDIHVHGIKPTYDQRKPVFFGHYWMQGAPVLQAEQMACVDYSAGKGGPLVAYRWSGESAFHRRISSLAHRRTSASGRIDRSHS